VLRVQLKPLQSHMNAYPGNFSAALAVNGVDVSEFDSPAAERPQPDVIVLHWPNELFTRSKRFRGIRLLGALMVAKARGVRLVWVVHNLAPHGKRRKAAPLKRRIFFALLDGLIFLSSASRDLALSRYPELSGKPFLITAHGLYADKHRPPTLPRRRPRDHRLVLGCFGRVLPYKGLDHFARLASDLPDGISVEIAGRCTDAKLKSELLEIADPTDKVLLDLQ
jgi:beta-1,4-mannosyltransferase